MLALAPALGIPTVESSSRANVAHIRSTPARVPGQEAWGRKVSPYLVSSPKGGHWTGEFVAQRRSKLLAQARYICRNTTDAEDLVQDVVVRFFQSFQQEAACPNERSCEAWLVRALNNLFVDQCRRRKVQAQVPLDTESDQVDLVAPEPAEQPAYASVTDEKFAQALEMLGPKVRVTFELHAAGKKYHEIAESQGIPVGTVAKRLHDARAKLRQLLQPDPTPEVH